MLTVTVEIDAPAGMGQGAKEAVAMRLEGLGGVRVLEVRETDGQQTLFAGKTAAAPAPGPATPPPPAAPASSVTANAAPPSPQAGKASRATGPMKSCFNCAARYGDSGLIEGKLAYGACRINRSPVRDLRGVCKQWSERR